MAAKKAAKKTTSAKKATASKAAKMDSPATPAPEKKAPPSLEAIARGAYLNYRRRVENGLPGDSHGDWLEAERQLREQV